MNEEPTINFTIDPSEIMGDETVELHGVTFFIRPPTATQTMLAVATAADDGYEDLDSPEGRIAVAQYVLVARVKRWLGPITPDGTPAPCNMATKQHFFNNNPQLLIELAAELRKRQESAEKNSKH